MAGPETPAPQATKAEVAAQVLAEQQAANRAEEVLFLSKLTPNALMAFMLNQSDSLREVVAQNLQRNFKERLPDLTPEELGTFMFDIMAMAADEANLSVFEFQQQQNEALEARALRAEADAEEVRERFGQLVYDVRVARAGLLSEFSSDEDTQSIIQERLFGSEDRPLPEKPAEPIEAPVSGSEPTTGEVLRALGITALRLPGVAIRQIGRGIKTVTGEIKKSA